MDECLATPQASAHKPLNANEHLIDNYLISDAIASGCVRRCTFSF